MCKRERAITVYVTIIHRNRNKDLPEQSPEEEYSSTVVEEDDYCTEILTIIDLLL
jgi:hypothetical protein